MKLVAFFVVTLAACALAHNSREKNSFEHGKAHRQSSSSSSGLNSCGASRSMNVLQMRTKLAQIVTQPSTGELVPLLKAMMTSEGQSIVSSAPFTSPTYLESTILQLQNPAQQAQVQAYLIIFASSIQQGRLDEYLTSIFNVYILYQQRQAAITAVGTLTPQQLQAVLQAFVVQGSNLPGFNTAALQSMITLLQTGGTQGYNSVIAKLTTLINSADCATLNLATAAYAMVVGAMPNTGAPISTTGAPPTSSVSQSASSTVTQPGVSVPTTGAPSTMAKRLP